MGGNARAHRIGDSRIPTAHKTGVGYADESKQYQPFQLGFFLLLLLLFCFPPPSRVEVKMEDIFKSMRTDIKHYPYCTDCFSGDLSGISGVSCMCTHADTWWQKTNSEEIE